MPRRPHPDSYENRIPELQLTNTELNEDMQRIIEATSPCAITP
jgi:hypothetical protein